MAFVPIDSALDIHDVLEADSEFSSLIGTLTLDGEKKPALLVALASDVLEDMEGASGLLVVIERDPSYTSRRLLTAQVVIDRQFSLRLIQFESDPRNLRPAIERLLQLFPGSSAIPLATPDLASGDGQAVVKLPTNPVAHT